MITKADIQMIRRIPSPIDRDLSFIALAEQILKERDVFREVAIELSVELKKVDEFAYLWPRGSFGEISQVFNIPTSTVQDLLKRRVVDNFPKYGPY